MESSIFTPRNLEYINRPCDEVQCRSRVVEVMWTHLQDLDYLRSGLCQDFDFFFSFIKLSIKLGINQSVMALMVPTKTNSYHCSYKISEFKAYIGISYKILSFYGL